jgi:hypothetical protein
MTVSVYDLTPLYRISDSEREALQKRNRQIDIENRKAPRNRAGEIPD